MNLIKTFLLLCLLASKFLVAQTPVDSLLAVTRISENDSVIANAYNKLTYEYQMINYDSSFYFANKALYHAKRSNSSIELSTSYKNLGRIYAGMDQVDFALEYLSQALQLDSIIGDKSGEGRTLMGIGNVYAYLGNISLSMNFTRKALKVFTDLSDTSGIHNAFVNLGINYLDKKDYDSALFCFDQSINIYGNISDPDVLAQHYLNLGDLYLDQGNDLIKALENLDMAAKYAKESNNQLILWWCILYKGKAYLELNDFKKAKSFIDECNLMLEKSGIGDYQNLYGLYSIFYTLDGDYENALHYTNLLMDTKDSLYSENAIKRTSEFQVLYTTMLKEDEIHLLKSEEEIQKLRTNLLFITVLLTVLLIIILIFILRQRMTKSKIEKQKLQEDLDQKNKVLANNALFLVQKNEMIVKIVEKLNVAFINLKPENQPVVKGIISDLELNLTNVTWKEFEMRFQQVHDTYYINIQNEFPDLSPGDLKLCALLRLNLSTKDIASITQKTPESVDVARSRLRKKLNIDKSINLVRFLMKY